jgi:molybdopterin synthase sulfur carrier subunit
MQIKVLYFAQLRERFGLSEESLSTPDHVANIADLIALLAARGGVWQDTFSPGGGAFRVAMNQDMATLDTPLQHHAEVAIFRPVTGG